MTDQQRLKRAKLRKQNLELEIEVLEDEIKLYSGQNAEKESLQKDLEDIMKGFGMIPIDVIPTEDKILVIDYNIILPQYKNDDVEELRQDLEKEYGCKVLLIDTSRYNIQGSSLIKMPSAVFFV